MARVFPFRALRYHSRYAGEMSRITTPPYDVIGEKEKEEYARSHPRNIVRLILPGEAGRMEDGAFYPGAALLLDEWRREATLVSDPRPAFYPYRQTYQGPDGVWASRLGFLGALALEGSGGGGALPHEKTLRAPMEDRTRLILACRANLSPIFLLHPDGNGEVGRHLARATESEPLTHFSDPRGVRHELWAMEDPDAVGHVQEGMATDWTLIADGHHRYESALAVMAKLPDQEGARYVLAFFCSLNDRGFRIFPIHRLLRPDAVPPPGRIRDILEAHLKVEPIEGAAGPETALARLREAGSGSFGVLLPGHRPFLIRVPAGQGAGSVQDPLRDLDTVLLQREILSNLLGISEEEVSAGAVRYAADAREAFRQVGSGEAAAAFLLNPLTVEMVVQAARSGLRLPQKSTYFYPKLLTGLVIRPF